MVLSFFKSEKKTLTRHWCQHENEHELMKSQASLRLLLLKIEAKERTSKRNTSRERERERERDEKNCDVSKEERQAYARSGCPLPPFPNVKQFDSQNFLCNELILGGPYEIDTDTSRLIRKSNTK